VNRADIARGSWIDPTSGKISFRAFAEDWLKTKVDVSPRTLINIEGGLTNHALPFFGDMHMNVIRPADARRFVTGLIEAGLAPSTVKGIYRTTAQVFQQAVDDSLIAKSPCVGVRLPSERKQEEMYFLTAAQVRDLAESIGDRYQALVYMAAYTGLRAGELHALTKDAVDLRAGTITVQGAASEVRGELRFGPTKTGNKRLVAVPRSLAAMLREHLKRFPSDEGFVFLTREGRPIRHRNFYRRHFRPAVDKAHHAALAEAREPEAIPLGLRFHDLRHTCAALLIANGRHMEEVKDHLGHSSIRVTSDRYGHLFPSARKALAESLEATFQAAASSARMAQADGTESQTDEMRTKLQIVCSADDAVEAKNNTDQVVSLERTTGFEPATLTLAR